MNEQTGLVFPKHDVAACAAQVFRLLEDRVLYNHLRHDARRAIEERFEIEEMMNRLEASLRSALDVERQAQAGKEGQAREPKQTRIDSKIGFVPRIRAIIITRF